MEEDEVVGREYVGGARGRGVERKVPVEKKVLFGIFGRRNTI